MKYFFAILFLAVGIKLFGQIGPNLYYLEFTDKNNTPYSIDNPSEFLSERAINRRNAQNIAIDSLDLPVNATYIEELEELGLEIHNVTRWFNAVTVKTENYELVRHARNLPFVKDVSRFEIDTVESRKELVSENITKSLISKKLPTVKFSETEYGFSYNQIALHNGHTLHSEGFKGEGMLIAVIDGGFTNANNMRSLEHLRNSGKIIATKDFVYGNGNIYSGNSHGSMVLSIMAGYLPGEYIGTAPEAEYLLLTSECNDYEEIVEEFNWISAIEYADSMGADVSNTSLGYVDFDSQRNNHSREDMDGNTCPSSIAAKIAASRGMILLVAAGNSGNYENGHVWISAPSDADDIICVGAIDVYENYAPFSSHGFVENNRVKPDITSVGWNTYLDFINDSIATSNGTSFATPLMTGLVTCFWQKFHEKTSAEIRETIYNSTRRTEPIDEEDISLTVGYPNIYTGRGIVDFAVASNLLTKNEMPLSDSIEMEIFPNPTSDKIYIKINSEKSAEINIFSTDGRLLDYRKNIFGEITYNFSNYKNGEYIISLSIDNKQIKSVKILKQ